MKIDPETLQELRKAYNEIRSSGDKVQIISAYKMDESEKKMLMKDLPLLNNAGIIYYNTDPSILAGVIIKFGSKMIDLSLQNELTNLKHFIYERI